ncbi:MAG: VCBS repeat-containing protein [Candidatus Eisenbacteria bacterium]|uniref:VCBS repeat-containing protein n=1 Tax=Eiseniibacteriota bacterium TaxID=2212470 RepID=A0A956NIA7_UNCEI|nr:VCBS repeat-containing protein [Candidatus Eisenbacteria bacterium]
MPLSFSRSSGRSGSQVLSTAVAAFVVFLVTPGPGRGEVVPSWSGYLLEPYGAAPLIVDLDVSAGRSGDVEAVRSPQSFGPRSAIPSGPEVVVSADVQYAWRSDGSSYSADPNRASAGARFSHASEGYVYYGKPAAADLSGSGVPQVVAVANHGDPSGDTSRYCVVLDNDGHLVWRVGVGSTIVASSPSLGDIDGDGDLEIVFLSGRGVVAFHHDGRPVGATPYLRVLPAEDGFFMYASVVLAELDPDVAGLEILFPARALEEAKLYAMYGDGSDVPGFPYDYGYTDNGDTSSNSSPCAADIDGDGVDEVWVATKTELMCIDPNASPILSWARSVLSTSIEFNSSPALGDIDRDGHLEVAIGAAFGRLYVLDAATGDPHPAFQSGGADYLEFDTNGFQLGSPLLADLTGDGYADVVVRDNAGRVYAVNRQGTLLPGFPLDSGTGQTLPCLGVGDLLGDGTPDLVVVSAIDQTVDVYSMAGVEADFSDPIAFPWPQFRRDPHNTGVLPAEAWNRSGRTRSVESGEVASTDAVSAGGSARLYSAAGAAEAIDVVGAAPNPTYGSVELRVGTPVDPSVSSTDLERATQGDGTAVWAAPLRVLDATGRVVRVFGAEAASRGVVVWDGRDEQGKALPAGVYYVAAGPSKSGATKVVLLKR